MRSLYDLLGAQANDDAQAIKKAFRSAVKAHHPDLHPDDPDAVVRFRQVINASVILRDAKQRAAYDQLLELERQQIKSKLDRRHLQLRQERRKARWKRVRATAAIAAICGLIGAYRLLAPMATTPVAPSMKDKPAAGTVTIVGIARDDRVSTVATQAGRSENGPSEEKAEAETTGAQLIAHADVAGPGLSEGAIRRDAATSAMQAADKGAVVADRGEPAPGAPPALLPSSMPLDASFYRDLGISSYRLGDFPRAIVNLDEAIRLDPRDAHSFNVRGNAWDEIGVFDSALADHDEAIRIDPDNPAFFHDRAILWHRKGELDKALVDLDRAIRFSFSDPNLYCDRGLIWYEKGSHARAIADFNQAAKLDPNFTVAYIARGLILHRDSEFTVSFADLGKMIRINPSVFDVSRALK